VLPSSPLVHSHLHACLRVGSLALNYCCQVCLTSNLLSNSCTELDSHHIKDLMEHGHPFIICTDDKGDNINTT